MSSKTSREPASGQAATRLTRSHVLGAWICCLDRGCCFILFCFLKWRQKTSLEFEKPIRRLMLQECTSLKICISELRQGEGLVRVLESRVLETRWISQLRGRKGKNHPDILHRETGFMALPLTRGWGDGNASDEKTWVVMSLRWEVGSQETAWGWERSPGITALEISVYTALNPMAQSHGKNGY